jgi:hypothetical protein
MARKRGRLAAKSTAKPWRPRTPKGVDPITGERAKRGRPPKPPVSEQDKIEKNQRKVERIRELAGLGVPPASIASLVAMPLELLQKRHEEDMALGRAQAIEEVLRALKNRVTEGGAKNTIETLFWCKCNAGWAETAAGRAAVEKQEQSEDDTKAITFEFADRGSKTGG